MSCEVFHVGDERICSVSTLLAVQPSSSVPRRRYLSPARLIDRREMRVRTKSLPSADAGGGGTVAFVSTPESVSVSCLCCKDCSFISSGVAVESINTLLDSEFAALIVNGL